MAATFDAILRINAKATGEGDVRRLSGAISGLGGAASRIGALTTALTGVGAALGGIGVAAGAKGIIDMADSLDELSQRSGVTVETLSKLGLAARQSGLDTEQVSGALVRLSRNLGEIATGGGKDAASALSALGISATDSSGQLKNADQILMEVADRFEQMPDGAMKAKVAMDLFGRAGAALIPMLNMGSDAIQNLNTGISKEFARDAGIFNDRMETMRAQATAFGAMILEQVLPHLIVGAEAAINFGDGLVKAFEENLPAIQGFIAGAKNAIGFLAKFGPSLAPVLTAIAAYRTAVTLAAAATALWGAASKLSPVGLIIGGVAGGFALAEFYKIIAAIKEINEEGKKVNSSAATSASLSQQIKDATEAATIAAAEGNTQREKTAELAKQNAINEKIYSDQVAATNQRYDIGIQAINRLAAALQQNNSIAAEQNNLQVAQNNLGQVILQNKLALAKTDQEKLAITKQIAALEQEAARLQYQATMQQIQAERALLQIKKESANKEWEKASAAAQVAKNLLEQGRISEAIANKAAAQARQAQAAAAAANNELRSFNQKANIQAQTANVNMRIAEIRAQGQVQQAQVSAQQAQTVTQPTGQPRYYIETPNGRIPQFAKGGFVTRPTLAVVGEGGEDEYMVPQSKAMAFANNIVAGRRGEAAIRTARTWTDQMNVGHLAPRGGFTNNLQVLAALRQQGIRATVSPGSGMVTSRREGVRSSGRSAMSIAAPPIAINIQTGPVVEMNGQRYVSYDDLERAMRVTADGVIGRLRTPYARQALGR
jgi:hypothetical protein